ncbi:hypothetical protein ACFWP5_07730 [Streptomyces sp. NPDC058469]|uniref:hypothetical protein n=1 Tax=Streptomyces sp. NPDC058469 TaxID=3346514 RepID=UPI0036555608
MTAHPDNFTRITGTAAEAEQALRRFTRGGPRPSKNSGVRCVRSSRATTWPAPAGAEKPSDEDRRGLTALFWSDVNVCPYGTFGLDMDERLDLGPAAAVPRPRTSVDIADRSSTGTH